MAKTGYVKSALTGGGASALDGISGAALLSGDFAFTWVSGVLYFHVYTTSSAAEASPDIIVPDTADPGNLRWLLQSPTEYTNDMWTSIANYTATPASTSTIPMTADLTGSIVVGIPLKYVIAGTTYYGICTAITSILLTVAGAPLSGNVTSLYYGKTYQTTQVTVMIPGLYEDASNTALIVSDLNSALIWQKAVSYLVKFSVYSKVHDTGTHGQASVRVNGAEVNATVGGETIAADATWYPTVVNINTTNYDINYGEAIEITAVKAGTGDATDLTVSMVFVTP